MRDLERERAADALARVSDLPDDSDLRTRYRSYVDRFGGAVVMNGLGSALATELAASAAGRPGDRAHEALAANVARWLRHDPNAEATELLTAIVGGTQGDYLHAQAETLAWLTWHKKFCHALLPKAANEE